MTERGLEKEWMLREPRKVGRSEVVLFVASRAQGRKGNIGQGGERNGGGGGAGASGYKTDKESFGMKSYFVL